MRHILLIAVVAAASAADASVASAPTIEACCRDLTALMADDARLRAGIDLNRDRRIDPLEAAIIVVGKREWLREFAPQWIALIDADRDQTITSDEIRSFVDRGHSWKPSAAPVAKPKTMRQRLNLGGAAGGGAGAGFDLGGGEGGSAYCFFGNQQAYVADYNVVNGQLDPVVQVLGYGTVLELSRVRVTIERHRLPAQR
jgi:hypothetical protein